MWENVTGNQSLVRGHQGRAQGHPACGHVCGSGRAHRAPSASQSWNSSLPGSRGETPGCSCAVQCWGARRESPVHWAVLDSPPLPRQLQVPLEALRRHHCHHPPKGDSNFLYLLSEGVSKPVGRAHLDVLGQTEGPGGPAGLREAPSWWGGGRRRLEVAGVGVILKTLK